MHDINPTRHLPCCFALGLLVSGLSAVSASDRIEEETRIHAGAPDGLAQYRAIAEKQARDYDQIQDISPEQLLLLLEVSERTGTSLGQMLATGEFESAKTWNDFVRPTLGNGRLGSATGVWQFIPATFHRIIEKYGVDLLAASSANAGTGQDHLDLSAGPFSDAQVRAIIRDTTEGVRGVKDERLQLLRHNFAVLAFAKHYLSVETGATTPEEDYLFHFLGEKRGRQILALARGDARDTLSVAPQILSSPQTQGAELVLANVAKQPVIARARIVRRSASTEDADPPEAERGLFFSLERLFPGHKPNPDAQGDLNISPTSKAEHSAAQQLPATASSDVAIWSTREMEIVTRIPSEWSLPADSPIVTGNPGMFYRDGHAKSDPYTWSEFMSALSRRVHARRQPGMVRAKYGVGFQMNGGDSSDWTLKDDKAPDMVELRHEIGNSIKVPQKLLTGPLDTAERRAYKRRLAALIRAGEARPVSVYSPPIVVALQHLNLVSPDEMDFDAYGQALRDALGTFRKLVGKHAPDDPALADKVMPAERVALEIYDQRIARYAALQSGQQAAIDRALDLRAIRRLLKRHRHASKPHIATLQKALALHGLQTQTRAGSRHFDGIAGKLTIAALDRFQLGNGLRPTQGLLDPVTASMLGLAPMSREIFLTPSGPYCPLVSATETALNCTARETTATLSFYQLLADEDDSTLDWPALLLAKFDHQQQASGSPLPSP